MNKLLLYSALLLLTQCSKCKNDPAPEPPASPLALLPPETQTGQRTFGCLVNGEPWTPAGDPFAGPVLSTVYMGSRYGISADRIRVINEKTSFQRMGFSIKSVFSPGTYALTDSLNNVGNYTNYDTRCNYYTSPSRVGTVVITTFDPVARIVAGRFSFTLDTPGCGRVVVTDGRFDSRF